MGVVPEGYIDLVIQLGNDVTIPTILPAAFYALHVTNMMRWTNDADLEGTVVDYRLASPSAFALGHKLRNVSATHLVQLLQDREWLRVAVMKLLTMSVLPERSSHPPEACYTKNLCRRNTKLYWRCNKSFATTQRLLIDPMRTLAVLNEGLKDRLECCPLCQKNVHDLLDASRRYLWAEMPF